MEHLHGLKHYSPTLVSDSSVHDKQIEYGINVA